MKSLFKYLLAVAAIFSFNVSIAQKGKVVAKQTPVVKKAVSKQPIDTFSFQITDAIKKVTTVAVNPKKTAMSLASVFIKNGDYEMPIYSSTVAIPGKENTLQKGRVNRLNDTTQWKWNSVIVSSPRGVKVAEIHSLKEKIDSILQKIPELAATDSKNHISMISVYESVNQSWRDNDILELSIWFTKPNNNTEQQAIDSILKMYRPMLSNVYQAREAAKRFPEALLTEDVAKGKVIDIFKQELKATADVNTRAAFEMLMGVPYSIPLDNLKDGLTYNQKQDISGYADELVKGYYKKNDPVSQVTTPVSSVGTTEAKTLEYTRITSLTPKDGYSSKEYYVVGYDHTTQKYQVIMREYVAAKKTFFKTDANVPHYELTNYFYTEEQLDAKYTSTGKHYKFCSGCGGSGVTHQTQTRTAGGWEQTNFNVHVYTTPRVTAQWSEMVGCPVCYGVGVKEEY